MSRPEFPPITAAAPQRLLELAQHRRHSSLSPDLKQGDQRAIALLPSDSNSEDKKTVMTYHLYAKKYI